MTASFTTRDMALLSQDAAGITAAASYGMIPA